MDGKDYSTSLGELILVEDGIIDKVTAIRGYTELLMERHAKDPHSLKCLSSIRKATDGLTESVDRIRQFRQKYQQE